MRDLHLFRRFRPVSRAAASVVLVVLFAALLTCGAVFFVWQRFQFIDLGFEVSSLRRQKAALEENIEPLRVEVEYLSRLERIETIARGRLGMRPTRGSQVIVLEGDETSAVSPQ